MPDLTMTAQLDKEELQRFAVGQGFAMAEFSLRDGQRTPGFLKLTLNDAEALGRLKLGKRYRVEFTEIDSK